MASLTVFCGPREVSGWWNLLCSRRGLGTILFSRTSEDDAGVLGPLPADAVSFGDASRVFGFPSASPPRRKRLTLDDVRSREWGWVDLTPGRILKEAGRTVLTCTQFSAEDVAAFKAYPAKHIRWLRQALRDQLTAGVKGKMVEGEGEAAYPAFCYTQRALDLFRSGCLWKQEYVANVVFEPLELPAKAGG